MWQGVGSERSFSKNVIKVISVLAAMGILAGCQMWRAGPEAPTKIGKHIEGITPALIEVPYAVEILKIDGELTSTFLMGSAMTVAVPPGERILSVRYRNLWTVDGDNHKALKSDIISFKADFKSGQTYNFVAPPYFKTPDAAEDYVENYQPKLLQASGVVAMSFVKLPLKSESTLISTGVLETDVSVAYASTESDNGSKQQAQGSSASPVVVTKNVPQQKGQAAQEANVDTTPIMESMKVLWHQLGTAEREAFQAWFVREVQQNMMSNATTKTETLQ